MLDRPVVNPLFPTITGAHWREMFSRARTTPNAVRQKIQQLLHERKNQPVRMTTCPYCLDDFTHKPVRGFCSLKCENQRNLLTRDADAEVSRPGMFRAVDGGLMRRVFGLNEDDDATV